MELYLAESPLTYALMAVNILVSLYALFVDQKFLEQNLFHMDAVLRGKEYHRLITAGFLHGDILHLLLNMWGLFLFGPELEYRMGTLNFAIVYFGAQLGGKLIAIIVNRHNPNYSALGASGSISGIMIAFCMMLPNVQFAIFGIVPMPAYMLAALYILYSSIAIGGKGRVAHEAHLGGAIVGGLLFWLLTPQLISIL